MLLRAFTPAATVLRHVRCMSARRQLMLTCERRVGDKIGSDDDAFAGGDFEGEVYPDLPVIGPEMAHGIEEAIRRRVRAAETGRLSTSVIVRTVAAQCLDAPSITRKIETAGNLFRGSSSVRGALLCVSGGDEARSSSRKKLLDCRFSLDQASRLRARGEIPESIDLWAVANPMTDSVDSFCRKVDAGARCFLTQPPFFPGQSLAWFEGVAATDQARGVDILVGVPMITSTRNLEFWLDLCGVSYGGEEARRIKASVAEVGSSGSTYIEWNATFIRETALQMPGVTGVHVMPVTASGLSMMRQVMDRALR